MDWGIGSPGADAGLSSMATGWLILRTTWISWRRLRAGGLARISEEGLSPGERQLLLLLSNRGLASHADGGFLLDPAYHASLVEGLAIRGVPLRASRAAAV